MSNDPKLRGATYYRNQRARARAKINREKISPLWAGLLEPGEPPRTDTLLSRWVGILLAVSCAAAVACLLMGNAHGCGDFPPRDDLLGGHRPIFLDRPL